MNTMITDKGIAEASYILVRDGYLDEALLDVTNVMAGVVALKAACKEYIKASVAKGDERSDLECRDALLIGFFEAFLEDYTNRIN